MTNEQPVLGLVQSQWEIELAKSGLPHQVVAPSITEVGQGVYRITPLAAHRDTIGESCWVFSFNVSIAGREVFDCIILEEVNDLLPVDVACIPRASTNITPGSLQQTIVAGESLQFSLTNPT